MHINLKDIKARLAPICKWLGSSPEQYENEVVDDVPLIDSYEALVEFNDKQKKKLFTYPISITPFYFDNTLITTRSDNYESIEDFLIDFITKQNRYYITNSIEELKEYDFTKLYSKTHPEVFKERLNEYVSNLILIGEKRFHVLDFEVEILESGLAVVGYEGRIGVDSIELPDIITEIGDRAFAYNLRFSHIKLPSSLKKIGDNAFIGGTIKEIVIPDSVEYIGNEAFCFSSLTKIVFPKNLKVLGSLACGYTEIDEVILPEGLKIIPYNVFECCNKLKRLVLPKDYPSKKKIEMFLIEDITSIEQDGVVLRKGKETKGEVH